MNCWDIIFKGYFDDMTSFQVYNVQKFIENRYKIQSQKLESLKFP